MKALYIQDFAAIVGIDWADQKHDIYEVNVISSSTCSNVISSKPEAIQAWAIDLQQRYPNEQVAVVCELKKGPSVYALMKYSHITIVPVHPTTFARYRKAFQPSGAKADASDARLITEMLMTHPDKFAAIEPESPAVRALAQLVESRRKLVQDRVNLTNSITWHLKNYYPQVLDWITVKDSYLFIDFIERWPNLTALKRVRRKTLTDFMHAHNVRKPELIEARIMAIKNAVVLTDDEGVVVPNQIMVETVCAQLRVLMQAIERIDKEIKTRYAAMADRAIFDSLPGAGAQLSPRLFVAFGTDRDRYASASDIQKYSGVAPVTESSGKKSWTHWRYNCPKFLRQTFVEWAGQTVRFSFWARAYYEQQKQKGKPHNTIIRSLAFKWIRIIFRCWKDGVPYDESKYLQSLRERGSPLLEFVAEN
jgi:transposase